LPSIGKLTTIELSTGSIRSISLTPLSDRFLFAHPEIINIIADAETKRNMALLILEIIFKTYITPEGIIRFFNFKFIIF